MLWPPGHCLPPRTPASRRLPAREPVPVGLWTRRSCLSHSERMDSHWLSRGLGTGRWCPRHRAGVQETRDCRGRRVGMGRLRWEGCPLRHPPSSGRPRALCRAVALSLMCPSPALGTSSLSLSPGCGPTPGSQPGTLGLSSAVPAAQLGSSLPGLCPPQPCWPHLRTDPLPTPVVVGFASTGLFLLVSVHPAFGVQLSSHAAFSRKPSRLSSGCGHPSWEPTSTWDLPHGSLCLPNVVQAPWFWGTLHACPLSAATTLSVGLGCPPHSQWWRRGGGICFPAL